MRPRLRALDDRRFRAVARRPNRGALAAAACTMLAVAAAPAGADTLANRAVSIDLPRRGAEVHLDGSLKVGRAEIQPLAGTHVYVLLARDGACGVLVDGKARLTYRVDDRFSVPVAERNLRRTSGLEPRVEKGVLTVSDELAGAVVWGWDLAPQAPDDGPSPWALPGVSSETALRRASALPDWADGALADRRFTPPSHDLLAAAANGVKGLRYALLRGSETLMLHVDPAHGEENLLRLSRTTDPGTTFVQGTGLVVLISQPIGHAWWEPTPRPLYAEHEVLHVENTSGETVRFTSRSRLEARTAVALWQPQLVDRVWDDKGHLKRVQVASVRVDDQPVDFLHGNDELLVPLGRTLAKGETVEVEVVYQGDLALRPAGNSYWVLGTFPWYPRQELDGELATMDLEVEVSDSIVPFASGVEVSRTTANGRNKLVTRLDKPMQFAVVAAGKFKVVSETRDGVTCRVATYALLNEQAARKLIEKFFQGKQMFEAVFDEKYPFHDFTMVEIADWGFGQAPPGIIFLTREFFTAPTERRRRIFFSNRNARFLHEVGHGWWGHVAKMNTDEESWLCEAFADYTAALAVWRMSGPRDVGDYSFDQIVGDWARTASDIAPGAALYLSPRLAFEDDRNVEDFWRLRYAKGPLVVHAIRLELQKQKGSVDEGDRYFIAFLRSYLNRVNYGWGTTPQLVATLNELTKTDWQPWFEKYVYGTETPVVPH